MKVVHLKLASKMTSCDMSQKDLAEQMHMTKSALNRRMTGKVEWYVSEVKLLCKIFDSTFEELFGD